MIIDSLGLITLQQEGPPGCWGDGCAEASRYVTLLSLLGQPTDTINLSLFITPQGVVRYPQPPGFWGPGDTSGDQIAPLIAATSLTNPQLCQTVMAQLDNNDFRTGNGTLANPCLMAQMARAEGNMLQQLWDISILVQALIFKLPFAWNPNASINPNSWFISSAGQSSGYLNFINFLAFATAKKNSTIACWLAKKVISSEKAMTEVTAYFVPSEPNVEWMLNLYRQALPKIW